MVTIALDAMGGDHFPKPEVEGALQAAKDFGRQSDFGWARRSDPERAGPAPRIGASCRLKSGTRANRSPWRTAPEKRCARRRTARFAWRRGWCDEGAAQGVVSAGNTGAVMATAKMVQGMLPGVDRPALASAFPTLSGSSAVMLDVGANVDCSPEMLAQFAVMGTAYSRVIFRIANPRVGLLSIGEEEHKGNSLTHEALPLLKNLSHINFIGNVEGRDVYTGAADVIVCDGFVGNVALKVSEGLVEVMRQMLKQSLKATVTRKVGAYLAQGAFNDFKKRVDYSEYGGAPLAGPQWNLRHLPRPLQREGDPERDSSGQRVRRR